MELGCMEQEGMEREAAGPVADQHARLRWPCSRTDRLATCDAVF